MIRILASALLAAAFAVPAFAADAPKPLPAFTAGLLGKPQILVPDGPVSGTVFLFADKDGWTADEAALADTLKASGSIVVGVDTTAMMAGLEADSEDECVYLVADIEDLSHQIQRALATPNYHSPSLPASARPARSCSPSPLRRPTPRSATASPSIRRWCCR